MTETQKQHRRQDTLEWIGMYRALWRDYRNAVQREHFYRRQLSARTGKTRGDLEVEADALNPTAPVP